MKNKTFLIDENSWLYKRNILFIALYGVLCVVFIIFLAWCNIEVGMPGVLALSFVNTAGALNKSQEISNAIIGERI